MLNSAIDSVMRDEAGPVLTPLTQRLWLRFDSALVAQLNAGRDVGAINGFLSRLSHYAGVGGEPGVRIGSGTFYREPPRFAPTYFAAQLGSDERGRVLAVFCYPATNGPSHLAVYQRRDAHWFLSDTVTSDAQIGVVGTHSDSAAPFLGALETIVGADGTTSTLRLWSLRDGRLIPVPDGERTELRNADLAPTDSSIEVRWTEHPRILDTGEMGIKRVLRSTYVVHGTQVATHTASLNPWLDAVEALVARLTDGRREEAAKLTESPEIVDSLWGIRTELIGGVSEDGSLAKGVGCVVIVASNNRDADTYWLLYLEASSTSTWQIVGASGASGDNPATWVGRPVIGRRRLTSACS